MRNLWTVKVRRLQGFAVAVLGIWIVITIALFHRTTTATSSTTSSSLDQDHFDSSTDAAEIAATRTESKSSIQQEQQERLPQPNKKTKPVKFIHPKPQTGAGVGATHVLERLEHEQNHRNILLHKKKHTHERHYAKTNIHHNPNYHVLHDNDDKNSVASRALICASRDVSTTTKGSHSNQCQAQLCPKVTARQLEDSYHDHNVTSIGIRPAIHYGHGYLHRPSTTTTRTMTTVAGQAKAGSGCALSHHYQFLYIHVLKSAGMTIKSFLKRGLLLCPNNNNDQTASCGTKEHDEYLQIVDCRQALQDHPTYFVWSFVRNPFARMYSSYAMALEYRSQKQPQQQHHHNNNNNNNTNNTNKTVTKHQHHLSTSLPPFSFETYVLGASLLDTHPEPRNHHNPQQPANHHHRRRALLRVVPPQDNTTTHHHPHHPAALNIHRFRSKLTRMDGGHWKPQTAFLFDARTACPVVDYIGHLEHLQQDLYTVLKHIRSPELWQEYHRVYDHPNGIHSSNATKAFGTSFGSRHKANELGGNLRRAYYGHGGQSSSTLQQAVAEEYAQDFDLLGYDPLVVPM